MHNSMNTYVGVEVQLHAVLITTPNGDECSASSYSHFTPKEIVSCSKDKTLVWQISRSVSANRRISGTAVISKRLCLSLNTCGQPRRFLPSATWRGVAWQEHNDISEIPVCRHQEPVHPRRLNSLSCSWRRNDERAKCEHKFSGVSAGVRTGKNHHSSHQVCISHLKTMWGSRLLLTLLQDNKNSCSRVWRVRGETSCK